MATYKVIQDIEAEDKLVGPLTLRQFIYAMIAAACSYVCFLAYTKHQIFVIGVLLPVVGITGFFAFPWKGEQPTEIWALARLRFMLKPRVRIWNQSGVKDVVTITAPRKVEARPRTNGLSEREVRSRLKALADTIDSRGWATRNASYGIYAQQGGSMVMAPGSLPLAGIPTTNDMFDEQGAAAQNLDAMLTRSSQNQRQRVLMQMAQAEAPAARPGAQRVFAPQGQAQPGQPFPQQRPMNQPAMPSYAPPTGPGFVPGAMQAPHLPQPIMPSPQLPPPVMPSGPLPGMPAAPNPTSLPPQINSTLPFAASTQPPVAVPAAPPANPADLAQPAQHLQTLLQQAAPSAPAAPTPTVTPAASSTPVNAPASDYWFAGGPGEPAPASTRPKPVTPPPAPQEPAQPTATATAPAPEASQAHLSDSYASAISSGKIMTDVPVAATFEPTAEEKAFGMAAREQGMAQQLNYSHMKVVQPAGAAPSIPGMIDYGRPQPVEDQMQYDTANSGPLTSQAPAAKMPRSIDQPAAQPVTRKPAPAILDLAKNDDLDVATIARQANKEIAKSPSEVEVRLH